MCSQLSVKSRSIAVGQKSVPYLQQNPSCLNTKLRALASSPRLRGTAGVNACARP